MDRINRGGAGQDDSNDISHLMAGIVKDNDDPYQAGRLKVFIPSMDSKYYETDDLPWATYVTPFGGTVDSMQVGRAKYTIPNLSTYGLWTVPKIGAHVLCGCMNGDPKTRFWLGCIWIPETNMTLPQSLNDIKTELDPSDDNRWPSVTIPHYAANLAEAGLSGDSTRGGRERAVSYPARKTNEKPSSDGYADKPGGGKDSQTYSLTTPGRHYMSMCDVDAECHIRFKTTEGHQIIMDDTNERIYISTAKGRNWVEIDEDGRIHIYAKDEINIRAEQDINMMSEKNINIKARKKVNIQSLEEDVNVEAKKHVQVKAKTEDISMTAKTLVDIKVESGPANIEAERAVSVTSGADKVNLSAKHDINVKSQGKVKVQASNDLHLKGKSLFHSADHDFHISALKDTIIEGKQNLELNTKDATRATTADAGSKPEAVPDLTVKEWDETPMVEPQHEPWDREPTRLERNQKWKAS